MKVMIINGPNLNLLGKREQSVYGNLAFEDYLKDLQAQFTNMNIWKIFKISRLFTKIFTITMNDFYTYIKTHCRRICEIS